jgi:hypothetical protein
MTNLEPILLLKIIWCFCTLLTLSVVYFHHFLIKKYQKRQLTAEYRNELAFVIICSLLPIVNMLVCTMFILNIIKYEYPKK